eukprot:XP_011684114.1 PREDICTED: uncharacterized protein LOC105447578 [Strongylocentrotus purpuratus]
MSSTTPVYSFDNDVFHIFATYSTLLIVSMMLNLISVGVGSMRDINHPHRIDVEELVNSVCFIVLGFFYVGTQPYLNQAARMIRIYLACRIIHAVSNRMEGQPVIEFLRRFSLTIGILINCYMAMAVVRDNGKF